MGWIWLIFLVFSVFANLMEKIAKEQKTSGSAGPSKNEKDRPLPGGKPFTFPPFLMGEFEEDQTESLPKKVPDLETFPVGNTDQGSLVTDEERNQLFNRQFEFEAEDLLDTFTDADDLEALENDGKSELGEDRFLDAFVLAQVLPRPDFRTVPWRRRL